MLLTLNIATAPLVILSNDITKLSRINLPTLEDLSDEEEAT